MNKRDDARKLKPAAQHMLRRQVVNAVRDGMKQVEAANLFSASLRAVNKWVALDKLGGLRALKAKRRGGAREKARSTTSKPRASTS